MNRLLLLSALLVLAGCEPPNRRIIDQEVRRKVFMDCLEKAPAGPPSTKYNDWAEVVSECSDAALRIAMQDTYLLPAMRDQKVEQ